MPNIRPILSIALLLAAGLNGIALGQQGSGMGAPTGGPSGNFLGPPSGNAGDFLGDWKFTWDGHFDSRCPCRGRLTIGVSQSYLSNMEHGRVEIGVEILLTISRRYGKSLEWLLMGD